MALRRWALPLAFVLTASSAAYAAPSGKDRADAAALTNKARTAFRSKRFDEAVDAFRQAEQLDPSPQRKLELAKALVSLNRLVEASQALNAVVNDNTLGAKDKWLKDAATKQLGTFESRIPWLAVHVVGPTSGIHVEVDGKQVDPEVEAPVDPGKHTVGVDADGYESGDQSVTLNEGEHKQVTLTLEPVAKGSTAPKEKKSSGGNKWPAIGAFGLGAVGLGIGTAFGVLAFDETAKAKKFCDANNKCPARPEVVEARNFAIVNGNVSTAFFVVGGVGAAAGVVLLLTVGADDKGKGKEKEKEKEESGFVVQPYVGLGEVGVVGQF